MTTAFCGALDWAAGAIVVASGVWLVGLAIAMFLVPARAARFLGGFASSARAHYLEQTLRLIAGAAMVVYAPGMRFSGVFGVFGWALVVTAIGLLLIPWTWHQRFGEWAIPLAIRYIRLYAWAAFALGVFVLYAAY